MKVDVAGVPFDGPVKLTCRRCRGFILVNKSKVFRKHNRHYRNGLGNFVSTVCEGSGVLPKYVKTDLEARKVFL